METEIIITNVHDRGFAFAMTGAGEQVFLPPYVASKKPDIGAGDSITAVLVVNARDTSNGGTPWMAVKLINSGDDEEELDASAADAQDQDCSDVSTPLDQQSLDALRDVAFASASDVAAMIGADTQAVRNSLHRLWTSGRCARAMIHNRFGQQRASLVMYAMSASDFLEVE